MYILIEHSGTEAHIDASQKIQNVLENDFGFTTDVGVSHPYNTITLRNEDMEVLVEFSAPPSDEEIRYRIQQLITNEDI